MRPLSLLALFLAFGATACATRPPPSEPEALAEYEQNNDPLEPTNRVLFSVHQGIDQAVLQPVARGYRAVVPQPVRTGIRNALGNLRSPVIFINDALQGEGGRARDTLARFMLNSTIGVAGIFDVAASMGLPGHTEDFGQTFATAGVPEGPFLFIPVLGPSNPRDLTGFGAGIAANPFTYLTFGSDAANYAYDYGTATATVVDTREGLLDPIDEVNRTSLDPYATLRSAYRQLRAREISNAGAPRSSGAPQTQQQSPPAALGTGLGTGTGLGRER